MTQQSWVSALHTRIAQAIKTARHGITAQQLATKTAELGYPITRSQIANYESGRRQSLDISELLILAHALNTPLLALLFPGPPNNQIEVIPGQTTTTADATTRHSGDQNQHAPRIAAMVGELDKLINTATLGRGHLTAEVNPPSTAPAES